MKRKSGVSVNEGELQELRNIPGYTTIVNSPLKTPMSAKGGRTYNKSKVRRPAAETPILNAGKKNFLLLVMLFYVHHY